MSNTARIAAQAANTLEKPLNVEEVFSTYLYDGTGSTQTITNGIDLDGEGGLVWFKVRTTTGSHALFDTERGVTKHLASNATDAEGTQAGGLTTFNTGGFTVGSWGEVNESAQGLTSWTFRKAPKFFDVVTYTGTGTDQLISHNLGCVPGFVVVKKTSGTGYWSAWHRSFTSNEYILLDLTNSAVATSNVRTVTDTHYEVHGSYPDENQSGQTYVAYLFAHNDGDGDFGPTGDQDIIKCGSYTGGTAPISVDLGFEPQWVLIKGAVGSTQNWVLFDTMRGITTGGADEFLSPNTSSAETTFSTDYIDVTANGFEIKQSNNAFVSQNSATYIYIAIRRGPMAVPESATDVFATAFDAGATNPTYVSGFVTDMGIQTNTTGYNKRVSSRLTSGKFLEADNTGAEQTSTSNYTWDFMNGWNNQTINSTWLSWMWKRAPSFFDVVAYTGNATPGRNINHNLGVAPEMIWVKRRSAARSWAVYHSALGNEAKMALDLSDAVVTGATTHWQSTTPTDTVFTVGTQFDVNNNGATYIAYLFASLPGVSKVGSYTGNGSTQNIDCGFSSGARFVLIKRTDSTGDWHVWDTERGIVAGFDPYLELNTTNAQSSGATAGDYIDPLSSGFALTSNSLANASGGTYIFYAIA